MTSKKTQRTRAKNRKAAQNERKPAPSVGGRLPAGVVMVSIDVPVMISETTGFQGGPTQINGKLKRAEAQALQRVRKAERARIEESGAARHTLEQYDRGGLMLPVRNILLSLHEAIEAKLESLDAVHADISIDGIE